MRSWKGTRRRVGGSMGGGLLGQAGEPPPTPRWSAADEALVPASLEACSTCAARSAERAEAPLRNTLQWNRRAAPLRRGEPSPQPWFRSAEDAALAAEWIRPRSPPLNHNPRSMRSTGRTAAAAALPPRHRRRRRRRPLTLPPPPPPSHAAASSAATPPPSPLSRPAVTAAQSPPLPLPRATAPPPLNWRPPERLPPEKSATPSNSPSGVRALKSHAAGRTSRRSDPAAREPAAQAAPSPPPGMANDRHLRSGMEELQLL